MFIKINCNLNQLGSPQRTKIIKYYVSIVDFDILTMSFFYIVAIKVCQFLHLKFNNHHRIYIFAEVFAFVFKINS